MYDFLHLLSPARSSVISSLKETYLKSGTSTSGDTPYQIWHQPFLRYEPSKVTHFFLLPYSTKKFWQEKTLVNFVIQYEFAKILSANCLQYLKKLGAGLKFAKVFSRRNFALYGIFLLFARLQKTAMAIKRKGVIGLPSNLVHIKGCNVHLGYKFGLNTDKSDRVLIAPTKQTTYHKKLQFANGQPKHRTSKLLWFDRHQRIVTM